MFTSIASFGSKNVSAFTVPEDSYENNDYFWSAYPIDSGFYPNLCQGDDDWFNVSIGVNDVILINLEFDGSQNNIDLELYDSMNSMLNSSYDVDNNEDVSWVSSVSQTLYIKIYGQNNTEAYNMTVDIDDWAEENDIREESKGIGVGFYSGFIQNDNDWFSYDNLIHNANTLEINMYYDTAFTLDIELTDEYNNPHGYAITSETWGKKLEWTAGGNYSSVYIHVYGSNIGLKYNITLIIDDWAEENDNLNEAEFLYIEYHGGMVNYDDDWYQVWLGPNDALTIRQYCDNGYFLELYDENETLLKTGDFEEDHYYLSWTNDVNDKYVYIKIQGIYSGDWYDIELLLNDTVDDWTEENDFWDSTKYLNIGSYDDLVNLDDDYFSFHLKEGDTGKINIYCENHASIWLEEINSKDGSILKTDYSTEDGFLEMEFYADYEYDVIFAVKGNNAGEWYDLELKIDYKDDKGDNGDDGDDKNNEDDPFANFDLSSIPGFPIEIVGTSFIISTLAVIFFVKKKKH